MSTHEDGWVPPPLERVPALLHPPRLAGRPHLPAWLSLPVEPGRPSPTGREGAPPEGTSRRRTAAPLRAVAGAAVAVAGVLLLVGTLLWFGGSRDSGSPTVTAASRGTATVPGAAPGSSAGSGGGATTGRTPSAQPSPRASATGRPSAAPTATPRPSRSAVSARPVPLTVLNNSRYSGLADSAAARFRAGGWPVPVVGNFTGRIPLTTVYYAPGQQAQARRLAARYPGIRRVLPRFRGLPGHGLTVVVTRDFRARS